MRFLATSLAKFKPKEILSKRWRLEHASMIDLDDEAILNKLKFIASIQPCHYTADIPWLGKYLSKTQLKKVYRWDRLKKNNQTICLGTDSPIEPVNPIRNFIAASQRTSIALTALEVLQGYTINAAYASFKESSRGLIKSGFDADFTLFSKNPLTGNYTDLRITGTIVNGEKVY